MQLIRKPVKKDTNSGSRYKIHVNTYDPKKKARKNNPFGPKITGNVRRRLILQADRLTSRYVILRDKFCVTCGTSEGLTNSHLFKRGRIPLRFDLENCNCQCATCNGLHNTDPRPYEQWFIRKFGQKKFDDLQVRSYQISQFRTPELKEIVLLLENLNRSMID